MKTDIRTGGFGGGFTDARTVRPRCRATSALPRDYGSRYRVVASKRDARPALACNALLWLCESVGWWLLVPLYVVVGRALWRVMWS